jgi:citrate synthase
VTSRDMAKMRALVEGAAQAGQHPNVFAALVILCKAMGLPNGIGAMLHTLARTTGWIAHAMEQRLTGAMLRPRAKYMGNPVSR